MGPFKVTQGKKLINKIWQLRVTRKSIRFQSLSIISSKNTAKTQYSKHLLTIQDKWKDYVKIHG